MSSQVHPLYKNHDNVKFLFGDYNTLLLLHNNFIYKRTSGLVPNTLWRCTAIECTITVTTYDGKFQHKNSTPAHGHPQPIDDIVLFETKMRIKRRLQTEFNLSPRQIHAEERMRLMLRNDTSAHLKMESFQKSKRKLNRYRAAKFPTNPKTRSEINLENEWKLAMDRSETFLLADDGMDDRILIFGTESNLRIICSSDFVISDGTFSVHPDLFAQFYVFHGLYLGQVLTLLFCLLPDKTYSTYVRLLELIKIIAKNIGCIFKPRKFHIDFELAMINAISSTFSNDSIQGCLFHFSQCIWRKVQDLGIASSYIKHKHVREWIRRLSALPFLPLFDIDDGFIEIQENCPDSQSEVISQDQIDRMHDYMLNIWVMDCNAKFDRRLWNQFENNGPRTTNNAEGWHNKINQLAKCRLSFYQFVHFLQQIQVDLDSTKFDLISESPSRRRNKYVAVNENIEIAKKITVVEMLAYLDSVSIAIKLD